MWFAAGVIIFGSTCLSGIMWVIWKEQEAEEERHRLEFIESVGGVDSPWINPNVSTRTHLDLSSIPDLMRVYPQSQASAPVPSSRPHTERAQHHVTPMVSADATPKNNTDVGGGVGVADVGGAEGWLERNAVHFPLEVPPENITSDAGLNALNEAREWIKKALTAGVSKRKIITEIFGASYGTNKASKRINQIIRDVQC